MAPEQIMSNPPSPSMDQYALGVMTYELLTGRPPFEAPDPVQLIFMHLQAEPARPGISEAVDTVVMRMLDKDPNARFPSVGQAGEALREALR
jgi:serine/threonine protein kinase